MEFATAYFALQMLDLVCAPDTPEPSLVPGVDGDLQIEWHFHDTDIELHVRAPNEVGALRQTADVHVEDIVLTNDFTRISNWLQQVTEPTGVAEASAA